MSVHLKSLYNTSQNKPCKMSKNDRSPEHKEITSTRNRKRNSQVKHLY